MGLCEEQVDDIIKSVKLGKMTKEQASMKSMFKT